MTEDARNRLLELLRHQVPDPNLSVQENPVTVWVLELLARVEALEEEVFAEEVSS